MNNNTVHTMPETKPQKVVTRFAPSPTGFLHIGGVRTALFAYLWARKNNGTFILRIEDTDKEREVEGSIAHIEESLKWLGINWDYGPDTETPFGSCIQSERLETYKEYAQKLIEKGLAYPDPYTQAELEVFRKQAEAEKRPFLYRNHRPKTFEKWDSTKPLRLKVPEIKRYKWNDAVRGDLEAGEEALDDFVLIKSDGYPTYNFAHIIDDYLMGVTHIMRADEFISSTPRFLSLYDALGIERPIFATLPPILKDDRTKKLGKRDGAKDILEYRTEGYLPEAMRNFLALIGWNPGTEQEIFDHDELIEAFDLNKIQKAGGAFNETKLLWLNHEWIKRLPPEKLHEMIGNVIMSYDSKLVITDKLIKQISPIVLEHVQKWSDLNTMLKEGELFYFFVTPTYKKESLVWKDDMGFDTTTKHLNETIKKLEIIPESDWDSSEKIKATLWDYATEKGRGSVLWPIRFALTGKEKSPDPFVVASILGKTETISRLRMAISLLQS